jgi:branched-chain amino acid transport system permease protein
MLASLAGQLLNGLASASTLFLIAVGLSLIFGVSRIVNFAHGSMTMIGLYVAISITRWLSADQALAGWQFWAAVLFSALLVALLGALIEIVVLRRIYAAPELLQLLATFAVVLMLRDATLWLWGPEDLLGPKAPGLKGAVEIAGRAFPTYELVMIAIGPVVLIGLWLLLKHTRFGVLIRAATQDRDMVSALGVNQAWLFTAVFALGSGLAALGGALQMPRDPAHLGIDLTAIGEAFVVVVVGGMGSIPGAYVAALLIAVLKSLCYGLGNQELFGLQISFSKLTMVVEFVVMAVVLIVRPWGLMGKAQGSVRNAAEIEAPLLAMGKGSRLLLLGLLMCLVLVPLVAQLFPYLVVLLIEVLIAVLFAVSLHFIMGPGGMHSFGHAAYFGLGAYGAAAVLKALGWPMEASLLLGPLLALAAAFVFGWFAVRLSGVYLAMLTLAFAQIVWSVVFQWDEVTGGSNGLIGLWPAQWLANKSVYYLVSLGLVAGSVYLMRRMLFAPFGFALRAARDSVQRSESLGINTAAVQWRAFMVAGVFCGLAGALFTFAKGTISPETISVGRSVDGLVMVLLGGIQSLAGPIVGSVVFTWLQDTIIRSTDYWRAVLGAVILGLVILFPKGIAGSVQHAWKQFKVSRQGLPARAAP